MLKIDAFAHIWPRHYAEALIAAAGETREITRRVASVPMMTDLDIRSRVMDEFGPDYRQILSLAAPPLDAVGGPETGIETQPIARAATMPSSTTPVSRRCGPPSPGRSGRLRKVPPGGGGGHGQSFGIDLLD